MLNGLIKVWDKVEETRKTFEVIQPKLRIDRSSVEIRNNRNNINLILVNNGQTPAYNVVITLDGWHDTSNLSVVHPRNEYSVLITLEQHSSIRSTRIETARIHIRFKDRWKYDYELSYPVTQMQLPQGGFDIQLDSEQPILTRPKVAFLRMRRILRESQPS